MSRRTGGRCGRGGRALASAAALAVAASAALVVTAPAASAVTAERWAGADRYATAVEVSRRAFPDGAAEVVVVNGSRFPDALAAAPLAALHDGPLLTVEAGSVPPAVLAELDRLRPQVVRVVGGSSAVSEAVVGQLRQHAGRVERLQGADRYATAGAVAGSGFAEVSREVVVASGEAFPDALAGGAAGAALGSPLLLATHDGLPQPTRDAITALRPTRVTLVGGPSVLSPAVQQQLAELAPGAVVRLGGADRYATAAAVAVDTWESAPQPLLASGEAFPDALAGAALGVPLLLSSRDCLPAATRAAYDRLRVDGVTGLGGRAALSDAALEGRACS